ncbi:nitroreductase family protein [Brevibacterium zhoupengii]|uniref:nitroreductase family protein n=1 Tax=Brevibacterium zhoupengii TaxID=2898795 RepID=UPI001E3410B3|nr:nitroreductase family protein [Brevibacterium zhoupengii]
MKVQETVGVADARREYTPMADIEEIGRNYEYDMAKFVRYSSTLEINSDASALSACLASVSHALEKGLAMEEPRPGFGLSKLPLTIACIRELEARGITNAITEGARGCLRDYVLFHDKHGFELPAEWETELRTFAREPGSAHWQGGSTTLTRAEIESATDFDYDRFIQTRYSARHFTGEDVAPEAIKKAVGRALKTPRVCNRETRRVHVAYGTELRNRLLTFHHGNRGFGHRLGAVLIITSDLRGFDMVGERNQPWIDGGLFAMSLAYALHADRLGTCMMNWSEDYKHDQLLREHFDLPEHEVIVTFLGVGHLPEMLEVAASPRPSVNEILTELQERA